jgi:hypothetical protein
MRTSFRAVAVVALFVVLHPATVRAQTTAERVCLAVSAFENTSDWHDDGLGLAASNEMSYQLFATGDFTIIGPAQVRPVLEELEVEWMDPYNAELAAKVAERVGCPYILAGRVSQFSVKSYSGGISLVRAKMTRASATVDAYLLDTTSGVVVLNVEGHGTKTAAGGSVRDVEAAIEGDIGVARETLRPAVEDILQQIVRRAKALPKPVYTLAGNVVGVGDSGGVYIDRGANFDLAVGQRFLVFRVIDEIRGTGGEMLDQIVEQVGVLEVSRVLSQSAVCTIVEGEAVAGDTVRAAPEAR